MSDWRMIIETSDDVESIKADLEEISQLDGEKTSSIVVYYTWAGEWSGNYIGDFDTDSTLDETAQAIHDAGEAWLRAHLTGT